MIPTPTPAARRRPPKKPHRRSTQIRRNAVVIAWILAAGLVAIGVVAGPLATWGQWLPLHMLLLGGIGSAITIWSAHFADTLLHRPAWGGATLLDARLYIHSLASIAVLTGITTDSLPVALAGVSVVVACAMAGVLAIVVQYRRAVAPRFAALALYYAAAMTLLGVGASFGFLTFHTSAHGGGELPGRFYLAHTTTMLLGFVGVTVLGTLVVLWPTMLRTKMEPQAPRWASRVLLPLIVGTCLCAASGWWLPAGAIGVAVYLIGSAGIIIPAVKTARRVHPASFATASAAAAVAWFVACVCAVGVACIALDMAGVRELIHGLRLPLATGFSLQILFAALTYLTPVMLGGGPASTRASNVIMDRWAAFRVSAANAALLLACLPWIPTAVRLACGVLAAVLATYVPLAMVLSWREMLRRRSSGTDDLLALSIPTRAQVTAGTSPAIGVGPAQTKAGESSGTEPTAAPARLEAPRMSSPSLGGGSTALSRATAGRRGLLLGLVTAAGVGAVASLAGRNNQAAADTSHVTVTVSGMRFVPAHVDIPAGNRLIITLHNTGDQVHDLVLASGASTGRVAAGESARVDAGIITSSTQAWCSIAGHRGAGMVLTINAGSQDQAGHDHTAQATQHAQTATALTIDPQATPPADFSAHPAQIDPATSSRNHALTLTVTESAKTWVGAGIYADRWTYNGSAPGPLLRGKVGDTFDIRLVNHGSMSHSIDFHASLTAPDEVMRSINPGEDLTYRFTARHSGIWLYHCSTAPMSVHLASGMYGAVIIDPEGLGAVDREFLLVQSELYVDADGVTDAAKVAAKTPDLMAFNGTAFQYVHAPLEAKAGERVRFWVLDAGPSLPSSFHIVGLQFDTVFSEGAYLLGGPQGIGQAWQGGSQALALAPAQGGFVEAVIPAPGHYPVVTHAFADAEKGAKAILHVS